MKFSMWTSFLYGRPFESIVKSFQKAGFNSADLSVEHLDELLTSVCPLEQAKQWRDFARNHGVPLLQTHLAFSDLTIPLKDSEKQMDFLKRELELAVAMEIPAAVIHVSGDGGMANGADPGERSERIVQSLMKLSAFLRGSSTRLALENLLHAECRAEDLIRLIELSGKPAELGICLDTGHLHCTGGCQEEFLEQAADYLIALHIADNTGCADYHMLPLGRGTIDWRRFMHKLKSIHYPGIFNLEASGENSALYPEILDAKLNYAAQVVQVLLNLE